MTSTALTTSLTRRAVTVSTGALALCLFSSGVAVADTGLPPVPSVPGVPTAPPLPSVPLVPSPDNVVTTLDQTVTQATGSTPGTTTPGTMTPGTTTPTSSKPAKTSSKPAAVKPVTRRAGTAPADRAASQQMAALASWSAPSSFDSMTPTNIALPPATSVSASAGTAPAMAPLLMPQTQHVDPAAAMAELDKKSGSPVRGILLTLALAAAGAVGYGHLRVVRA